MHESILNSIKAGLNLTDDNTEFDAALISFINGILAHYIMLGINFGTVSSITDASTTWIDFLGIEDPRLDMAISAAILRCRLEFDPPTNSSVQQSFQAQVQEFEWLLILAGEEVSEVKEDAK